MSSAPQRPVGIERLSPRRSAGARTRGALGFRMLGPLMHRIQRVRNSQFGVLGGREGAVVFLGDSITEGGLWSDWFPGLVVSNRGTGGETTAQVLARLDSAIARPRAVFLLAGTNDLAAGTAPAIIAQRLARITDEIESKAPGCPVFLQSVMPRRAAFASEVLEVNERLREVAATRPSVEYVELWPALATPDGGLRPEYTSDVLHLNGAGYAAWVEVLRPIVLRFA